MSPADQHSLRPGIKVYHFKSTGGIIGAEVLILMKETGFQTHYGVHALHEPFLALNSPLKSGDGMKRWLCSLKLI